MKLLNTIIIFFILFTIFSCRKDANITLNKKSNIDSIFFPLDTTAFISATINGTNLLWRFDKYYRGFDSNSTGVPISHLFHCLDSVHNNLLDEFYMLIQAEKLKCGVIDIIDSKSLFIFLKTSQPSEFYTCGNVNNVVIGRIDGVHWGSGYIKILKVDSNEKKFTGAFAVNALADNLVDSISITDGWINNIPFE